MGGHCPPIFQIICFAELAASRKVEMFIAIDGDNIGSEIERLMILNEQKSLYDYSLAISRSIEFIKSKLLAEGGELILCGGDSLLVKIESITPHILSNVFSSIIIIVLSLLD